ncbi:MAG: DUF86 domain-containing protein [Actinomycetota bacterium]|nr:DUF86 domain-containing protein [Actinomycetota bacterium]MDI6821819.1 DUF86 domain-containing protein [Actinomycetota bacterium]
MLNLEIVNSRLKRLEKCVQRLKSVAMVDKERFLGDEDLQDKAERNFHIAIECCLDIGNHIISALGFRAPKNYGDIFKVLGEEKILPEEFSKTLGKMAGFRNILVHDYLEIDLGEVYKNLQKLEDFIVFVQYILEFIEKER